MPHTPRLLHRPHTPGPTTATRRPCRLAVGWLHHANLGPATAPAVEPSARKRTARPTRGSAAATAGVRAAVSASDASAPSAPDGTTRTKPLLPCPPEERTNPAAIYSPRAR